MTAVSCNAGMSSSERTCPFRGRVLFNALLSGQDQVRLRVESHRAKPTGGAVCEVEGVWPREGSLFLKARVIYVIYLGLSESDSVTGLWNAFRGWKRGSPVSWKRKSRLWKRRLTSDQKEREHGVPVPTSCCLNPSSPLILACRPGSRPLLGTAGSSMNVSLSVEVPSPPRSTSQECEPGVQARPGPARLLLEEHPLSFPGRKPVSFITTPGRAPRGSSRAATSSIPVLCPPHLCRAGDFRGQAGTAEPERPAATIYRSPRIGASPRTPKAPLTPCGPMSDIPNGRPTLPWAGAGLPLSFAYFFPLRTVRVRVGGLRMMSVGE